MSPAKRALFLMVTGLLVLAAAELAFYGIAAVSPRVDFLLGPPSAAWKGGVARWFPDDDLHRRPNPEHGWHDANGWRNPAALAGAEIVTLGDSHTYGATLDAVEETWPQRLAALTDRSVYNMAFGGYGPVHGLVLWDEARALEPVVVIQAFYLGNDLYDSFRMTYAHGIETRLRTAGEREQERLVRLDSLDSIRDRIAPMLSYKRPGANDDYVPPFPISFLSKRSKVYGLLRRARYEFVRVSKRPRDEWEEAKLAAAKVPRYTEIFESDSVRTVFTPEYRLIGMNPADPRNAEGYAVALRAIEELAGRVAASGAAFHVVVIPTKETVFARHNVEPSAKYDELVATEAALRERLVADLARLGVPALDVLPALREAFAGGKQPYHVTRDGHPNAGGCEAIARAVAAYLRAHD